MGIFLQVRKTMKTDEIFLILVGFLVANTVFLYIIFSKHGYVKNRKTCDVVMKEKVDEIESTHAPGTIHHLLASDSLTFYRYNNSLGRPFYDLDEKAKYLID